MLTSTLVVISCVVAAQEAASPPASEDELRESVPEAVEISSAPNPVGDLSIIPLSFDLQHDGSGVFSSVVPLGCSVVLDGVTEVIIDALRLQFTTFSPASFSVSAELLSSGSTIAGPGVAISGGVRGGGVDSTDRRRTPVVFAIPGLPTGATFDAVRFTFDAGDGVTSLRLRGMHKHDLARVVLIRGSYTSGGHEFRSLTGVPSQQIIGAGATPWIDFPFDEPVPMDSVRYIRASDFGFSIPGYTDPGGSITVHSELQLSDGTALRFDNWESPGAAFAAPPEEKVLSRTGGSLLVDDVLHDSLAGRFATGWRFRWLKNGTGTLNTTPSSPFTLRFLHSDTYPSSDLDGDGIVGSIDLAILLGAWGTCSPCGPCLGDIDVDGFVDAIDVSLLLGDWGN